MGCRPHAAGGCWHDEKVSTGGAPCAVDKKACQRPLRWLGRVYLSTATGAHGDLRLISTGRWTSSAFQVHGIGDQQLKIASGLGHARKDPAFGLFFACQARPFDLIANLPCEQFAHAGPARSVAARVGQADAVRQSRLQQGASRDLFKLQTRGLDANEEG